MNYNLCLVNDHSLFDKPEGIQVDNIYLKVPKILRAIRAFHFKTKVLIKFRKIWLGNWRKKIREYDQIIIFDSLFDYFPIEYIREYNNKCKIHFCYRNRVHNIINHCNVSIDPNILREKYKVLLCSYNKEDCKVFKMRYYRQFHRIPSKLINNKLEIIRDVFFIGQDKNRYKTLEVLSRIFTKNRISYKIGIVPDKSSPKNVRRSHLMCKNMKYSDIINECIQSKCILDITDKYNQGITYRVIEAIVLNKKLITNNKNIIDSGFYNSQNIFVLGVDSIENLKSFIDSPNLTYDQSTYNFSFNHFCNEILYE